MKFLADRMLGKLAKYLVMLGLDTRYFTHNDRTQLIALSEREGRVILSRDTKLLRVRGLPESLLITDDCPGKQLRQVFTHFKLELAEEQFFTRCLRCNQMLIQVSPEEVKPKVPSFVLTIHQDFFSCPQCGRVYWKGTHHLRMKEMIRKILLPEKN